MSPLMLNTPSVTISIPAPFGTFCSAFSREFMSPCLYLSIVPPQSLQPSVSDSPTLLSSREIEVLSHIAYGKTNKEIANTLCISLSTVVSHRKHIMDKLNIHNLSALTIYAVMHGYVDVNMI